MLAGDQDLTTGRRSSRQSGGGAFAAGGIAGELGH
jgi:hypothetical protein